MNKEVLVALIAKDVNELQTLTEGLEQMETIPTPYLRLALDKSKALTTNIEALINLPSRDAACCVHSDENGDGRDAACCVHDEQSELEKEQAAREAELARIAEEQEALFRAEELERQRREEERRKAEAEIARQVAALEAARQAEIAAQKAAEEARRQAAEEARRQAEEEARQSRDAACCVQEEASCQPIEPINPIDPITPITPTSPITTLAESIETKESLADQLAKNTDDTLATAINNKKIHDLKSAITLGDRFRFQRELFGGNGEKMNKAIADFNSFETMEEAQTYMAKHFDWPLDNDAASDFIQLLQRRYL